MTTAHFNFLFNATQQARRNMVELMKPFTLAQANALPEGFRNNLVWNFGHVIVTQQLLCYSLAGAKPLVDDDLIAAYRRGSAPAGDISQEAFDHLVHLSTATLEQFKSDHAAGIFQQYNACTTSFGMELTSVEEAFLFNLAHEAMHLGTMIAMRKLV